MVSMVETIGISVMASIGLLLQHFRALLRISLAKPMENEVRDINSKERFFLSEL